MKRARFASQFPRPRAVVARRGGTSVAHGRAPALPPRGVPRAKPSRLAGFASCGANPPMAAAVYAASWPKEFLQRVKGNLDRLRLHVNARFLACGEGSSAYGKDDEARNEAEGDQCRLASTTALSEAHSCSR